MKTITITCILTVFSINSYGQEDCSKALEFKDVIKINRSGNTFNDVHNWFLSQNGKEFTSSDGWDANIAFPVEGFPVKLGGGSNSANYQKFVDGFSSMRIDTLNAS